MKIALFSDIHANLPAFESFLKDLDKRKPDMVYCLGDLIGYNVWPNEIIEEIRKRCIATIAGNHDLKTEGDPYELVSAENRQYLNTLPTQIRLDFQLNNKKLNIVLAHGSTKSINEYVLEDFEETYIKNMMIEANADILCIGHSHKPFYRKIETGGISNLVVNIGSVGKPKDGNPFGCYAILSINEESTITNNEDVHVDFIRFDYDIERAAKAIENSSLPNELIDRLKKAY